MECGLLNTLQARWQYAAEGIGLGFVQGKTMLWRRDVLEAHGGIRALAAEIAEDAAATKLVQAAGLRVHLVDSPFEQPIGRRTARQVWDRHLRWARLRRVTFPAFFVPEILSGGLPAILLGVVAAAGLGLPAAALAPPLLWYGAEAVLAWSKGWPLSPMMVLAGPMRDAMIPAMWVEAWTTGRTVWRGNTVPFDGAVSRPVASAGALSAAPALSPGRR